MGYLSRRQLSILLLLAAAAAERVTVVVAAQADIELQQGILLPQGPPLRSLLDLVVQVARLLQRGILARQETILFLAPLRLMVAALAQALIREPLLVMAALAVVLAAVLWAYIAAALQLLGKAIMVAATALLVAHTHLVVAAVQAQLALMVQDRNAALVAMVLHLLLPERLLLMRVAAVVDMALKAERRALAVLAVVALAVLLVHRL